MKKRLAVLLMLLMLAVMAGCANDGSGTPGQANVGQSSRDAGETALPEPPVQKGGLENLRAQAVDFAKQFPYAFQTTEDIPPEDIGWYTFMKLYEHAPPPTNEEGLSCFLKSDVDAYLSLRFGLDHSVSPLSDHRPLDRFDEEKQQYLVSLVGEYPAIEAEIVGQELNGDEIVYEIRLYNAAMDVRYDAITFRDQIRYRFEIAAGEDGAPLLRAVSAVKTA